MSKKKQADPLGMLSTLQALQPKSKKAKEPMTDLQFMQSPLVWPRWPVLPLKRHRDHNLECAFLYAEGTPKVYLGDIHAEVNKTKEYKTFEEIIADGWRVD